MKKRYAEVRDDRTKYEPGEREAKRAQEIAKAARLKNQGLNFVRIGARMGCSSDKARDLVRTAEAQVKP